MISVNKLTKQFGDFTAVDHIDFTVPDGDIFAFLGPNGAGKTTSIKMLTTLLKPTSGNIKLNHTDVVSDPDAARKLFGIVFQDPSLDEDLTAFENLDFHGALYGVPNPERFIRIKSLMQFVELWERKDSLVKTFSGGMRRRLEIARGLIHHPQFFFLDEPTLGLDPQTRNHIWDYVKNLNEQDGITVFFTTHYLEEAERYANHIAVIDHGHIISQGTATSLKHETHTDNLEAAFIKLTGSAIRDEAATAKDAMRMHRRMWHR